MREFIAEKVCVIEVGAENNPASPLYTKAFEVGEEQPILAQKNINGSYSINVNKDYYEKNKENAESLIIEILKATKEEMICLVPRELFTDSLIEIIKANDNIKSVSFWGSARISKDLLSKEIIDSISLWNYLDLLGLIKGRESIRIFGYMSKEELSKLEVMLRKYPPKRVIISGTAINQVNELLPLIMANKITIDDVNMCNFGQREYFSTSAATSETDVQAKRILREAAGYRQIIKNIEKSYAPIIEQYDNLEFTFNDAGDIIGSNNIKIKNRVYDAIISEAKKFNLTPLEAYLYFYNVVKLFKEYKEEPVSEKSEVSRKSEFVLFNEYIVCAGYTTILMELVERYNNPNLMISDYICYIKNAGFHARNIVEVKDRKYNVTGMYISDITGDSKKGKLDLFLDRLDYFLMTKQEVDKIDDRTKDSIPDCTDVLFYNQNGSNVSSKDFPSYAWDDAHYICWKFYDISQGRAINSFYLSDPLEIRQTAIPNEVITRAGQQLRAKMFTGKTGVRAIDRLLWIRHVLTFNKNLQDKLNPTTYEFQEGEMHI